MNVPKTAPTQTPSSNPKFGAGAIFLLILLGLLALLLIAKVLFSLNIVWAVFNYAFQIDESEGMIVAETVFMDRGVDIFAPLIADRFIAAPYTPLYYLLNWPFIHFLGPSFKPGRLISLFATIGIAFWLYKLTVGASSIKSWLTRAAGLGAGLIWGSLGLVAFWGGAVKPDITALFFSISGIYAVLRWAKGRGQVIEKGGFWQSVRADGWLYTAAVLFALAAMTKQTAFAAPAAGIAFAFLVRPIAAVKLGGVYGVLAFGPMLVMNLLSRGGFWYHIVTVHELPWSFDTYSKFLWQYIQNYQIYIVVGLAFVLFWLTEVTQQFRAEGWRPFSILSRVSTLPVLYLGAATATSFSTGTYGGNHNHLLEMTAALCWCAGLTLARLGTWWQSGSRRIMWIYPVVLILLGVQVLSTFVAEGRVRPDNFPVVGSFGPGRAGLEALRSYFYEPNWLARQYRPPTQLEINGYAQVAAYMNQNEGPLIYSDNVSLMLASGKPILNTDPFTQTHAIYFGRWDESKLVEMIRAKQFKQIVLRENIQQRLNEGRGLGDIYISPAIAQAVLDNYTLPGGDIAFIYVPKK